MTNEYEKLTYLQKLALEGEIAYILSTCKNQAEVIHKFYIVAKNSPEAHRGLLLEAFKKYTQIEESLFDKAILEVQMGTVPLWIWLDRSIEDLKGCSSIISSGQLLEAPSSFIAQSEVKKKSVESAFVLFCRQVELLSPKALKELCQAVLAEESLSFLHMASTVALSESKEDEDEIKPEILSLIFNLSNILSFKAETESVNPKEKKKREKKITASEVLRLLKAGEKLSPDEVNAFNKALHQKVVSKNVQFIVKKVYLDSKRSFILRIFDTEEEAENFIKGIEEKFPDIQKTCMFKIEVKSDKG